MAALGVTGHGLQLAGRRLDIYRTYGMNCKEPPALPLMVIPGFGPQALALDCDAALVRCKHFVRSQFGQWGRFCFVFHDSARESCYRSVRATFGAIAASEYTAHSAAQGRHDNYIAVQEGDIVAMLQVSEGWALVKSFALHGTTAGWVPAEYLSAVPV